MKTFYGEQELKNSLLKYTREHQIADAYTRGTWLENNYAKNGSLKGCFYGCMTQSSVKTLSKASEQYGLPLWYVHVTEKIYEGLPKEDFLKFPYNAIEILPVGLDMNMVRSRFNYELLKDQLKFSNGNKQVEDSIKQCMNLYVVPFDIINESAARSAESAARSAAWSAGSAAWSAESAAWSARSAGSAESAARSAESAAWSARSAAWSAESARENYYLFLKEILFNCITKEVSILKDDNVKTLVRK